MTSLYLDKDVLTQSHTEVLGLGHLHMDLGVHNSAHKRGVGTDGGPEDWLSCLVL